MTFLGGMHNVIQEVKAVFRISTHNAASCWVGCKPPSQNMDNLKYGTHGLGNCLYPTQWPEMLIVMCILLPTFLEGDMHSDPESFVWLDSMNELI